MKKITIVTAAFRAKNMPRVWESIKNQTYTHWEWLVINDGQTGIRGWWDGIYHHSNAKFVDIHWQTGRFGLYVRNVGVMLSDPSYNHIVFLDDDNEWTPDHLESMVALEESTGKTPYCWMHIKGKKPGSTFERIKKTGFSRQGIDLGCILYKKEHFYKYGFFRDTRQVTFDFDFMEKIYKGEGGDKFVCTEKPTLIFWHKRY